MIFHICPRDAWATAITEGFIPVGAEGFIHCSAADWVHMPATLRFRGRTDLLLLEIDEERLDVPVVWEDGVPPEPDGRQFPHLYGQMDVGAVVAVHDYPPRPDGSFPEWVRP
ncbi:uncharacterized protein (DUF952 family) [Actinoplanes campanulatus]|uniref:Uncharacterized protein (DUF952 family) n=1 Tax=Actinoplanes campanulatus TaxID=113559 RepID=A0A7W5ABI7_9ACTN|nr:DUF952 domain-containing protein [Actinoplanes campanulatus]MBB3093156.1 uncharacterized protein (DUF952 family) [Actinoplanes campanulatus]GGN01544.1 glutathione S-transferase [Actinoplanes campanulatus]GID33748.1 glutathione S-transferase [Actinoplanes campanulatus]